MKKFIFYIHSTAGLLSGLFILLMSLSGAALVYQDEMDTAKNSIFDSGYLVPVDTAYREIQKAYPGAQISSCEFARGAYSFFIYDTAFKKGEKALEVFVHNPTGSIAGERGTGDTFAAWLSKFHRSLHLGKTGEWLLGFFALIFLISIITGFILFRKKIFSVLLFRRSAWKKNNLHQIIGTWALLFNLMIAVSGFWMQRYVFKKEFYQSYNYTPVVKASPPLSFNFDSAYAGIKKRYPDFTAAVIYFAQSNKGKTAVYGSRASNAFIHSKKFADVIMLDSAGGISSTRLINENSAGDKYDIINSQLHMGKYGGWGIKLIYFVFGLTGALLSITGFLVWWRRRRKNELPESR
jgi:uncharacterized iron-regulated membrane protein